MNKTLLRRLAGGAWGASGAAALSRRLAARSLTVLCYHRVLPEELRQDYPLSDLTVTPEVFGEQLAYLNARYECLPLSEALHALEHAGPRRRPLLSVTFDDGYWDNAAHAQPVLKQAGVRATFFVISDLVGTGVAPWYDRLARAAQRLRGTTVPELSRKPEHDDGAGRWIAEHFRHRHGGSVVKTVHEAKSLAQEVRVEVMARLDRIAESRGDFGCSADRIMTTDELKNLLSDGHEIGSHTCTHPILTQLSDVDLQHELLASRAALTDLNGGAVELLAYPNGDFDERVVAAARGAGYRWAVGMRKGVNRPGGPPMALRRYYVSQARLSGGNGRMSPAMMDFELSGWRGHDVRE